MIEHLVQALSLIGRAASLRNVVKGFVDRYRDENAVLEVLRGRENVSRVVPGVDSTGVTLISRELRRDPNLIHKSLLRLERRDKVHQVPGGWRFGPIPQRVELVLKFVR